VAARGAAEAVSYDAQSDMLDEHRGDAACLRTDAQTGGDERRTPSCPVAQDR
jgi:hypothetical protein